LGWTPLVCLSWVLICLVAIASCKQRAGPDEVAGLLAQLCGSDSSQQTTAAQKLSKIDNDRRLLRPFARLLLDKELRARADLVRKGRKAGGWR